MASYKPAFRPKVRTIPSVLIIAAALMLGMFVYGFTASATLNSDANLAGGQNSVNGIGFNLNSNSVNYGAFGGDLLVSSVNFEVYVAGGATFSSGVRVFAKLNTDSAVAYNLCSTVAGTGTNNLAVTGCSVTAQPINGTTFGLDVVVIE